MADDGSLTAVWQAGDQPETDGSALDHQTPSETPPEPAHEDAVPDGSAAPPRSRRERHDAERLRYLDAAVDHLSERGYHTISLAEVARRAGERPRSIRRHFTSVEELVVASVSQLTERRLTDLADAIGALPEEPEAWIDASVDLLWALFSGPKFLASVELWVAARTNAVLGAELYPAEQLTGRRLFETVTSVLPASLRESDAAHEAIWSTVYLMRGLAMRRLLRDDPAHEQRILEMWKQHLFVLIVTGDDPDSLPSVRRTA